MKFKYTRVNIIKSIEDDINIYLSNKYVRKDNFKKILAGYEERRKCEAHEAYKTDADLKEVSDNGNKNVAWDLFLNLTIGVKETAFYLIQSLIYGYGINQDEFLTYLTMAIGAKLGDKETIKLLGQEVISPEIQKLAAKCIERIKFHEAEVKNREVKWDEIMARGKDLDYLIKKESGHSYCDAIPDEGTGMKKWGNFVEPIYDSIADLNIAEPYKAADNNIFVESYSNTPPPVPKRAESKQEATGLKSFFKGMFSKAPEASAAPKAALVPVVAPKVTSSNVSYKDILLKDPTYGVVVKLQEATINTNLTIRVNGQNIFEVKQYRAIKIPDTLENIKAPNLKFVFSYLNGVKLSDDFAADRKGTAHLRLDYNNDGRLEKLTLPNAPIYFKDKPGYPAFCIFKKIMCTLPVDSGQLGHLMQIAPKVEFNNVDEYTYKVELLG
ncbi:MAG TPA: hypothetical protein LFV66_05670 [Rickettsia endosymbiont of Bembidion lapponicum]|nr:hypothetical protein [Rickettsia endosymbiont of Bembidion lapponicum]